MIRIVTRTAPSDPHADAAALVEQLQLGDLRAGREPVESAVAREVERRRAEMQRAEERAGRKP